MPVSQPAPSTNNETTSTKEMSDSTSDSQITQEEFMEKHSITQGQMDAIENILYKFNFERVHYCMKALDWKWRQADGTVSIPTLEELKAKAGYLLVKSIKETVVATGGLEATYLKNPEDGTEVFSLSFLLAWWDEEVINDVTPTEEEEEAAE